MKPLEEYPPGIQNLLEWGWFHVTQLERLEREFRAWQENEAAEENEEVKQVLSRAGQARQRWEARVKLIGDGNGE